MPRPSHLSIDNILRFLQLKSGPVFLDEISRGLHLKKNDRRPLLRMLDKLKNRGLIDEPRRGQFVSGQTAKASSAPQKQNRPGSAGTPDKFPQHKASSRDEIK